MQDKVFSMIPQPFLQWEHRCILSLATEIPKVPVALTHADMHADDNSAHSNAQHLGAGLEMINLQVDQPHMQIVDFINLNFPERREQRGWWGFVCLFVCRPIRVVSPGQSSRGDDFMMHLKLRITGHFLHLSGWLAKGVIVSSEGERCAMPNMRLRSDITEGLQHLHHCEKRHYGRGRQSKPRAYKHFDSFAPVCASGSRNTTAVKLKPV